MAIFRLFRVKGRFPSGKEAAGSRGKFWKEKDSQA